jgi:hypothetical protein
MLQPPWMCNNPNCAFRNRLLADARLTNTHICTPPPPVPIFVNPFPPPKPMTFLPPPPLAPAPPRPFYFPPPGFPPSAPPAFLPIPGPPIPMMPPAPVPPGPYMLPLDTAPAALPVAPAQPPTNQKALPPPSPEPPKSPSIGGVVHETSVHKFQPQKGPISKFHKEALSDFEERTRKQEYRDLAESTKHQSQDSEVKPASQPPSKPQSILKHAPTATPAINQEVHVNVYNGTNKSKAEAKNNTSVSSPSVKSAPAKDAASVREEAIKRAHNLAQGIAKAAAPAAMMSGARPPLSVAGSHAASHVSAKAPSHAPAKTLSHIPAKALSHTPAKALSHSSAKAPSHSSAKPPSSHASKVDIVRPAPSNAPSTPKAPPTHRSNSTRARSSHHRAPNPHPRAPVTAIANANAQISPASSIESWRESVRRTVAA